MGSLGGGALARGRSPCWRSSPRDAAATTTGTLRRRLLQATSAAAEASSAVEEATSAAESVASEAESAASSAVESHVGRIGGGQLGRAALRRRARSA